MSRNRLMLVI